MSQKQTSKVTVNRTSAHLRPDAEVVVRAHRRRFSTAYKLRIVEEADACHQAGEIGALLRREGLYSSHRTDWRREREAGQLTKADSRKGRRVRGEVAGELSALRQENARLKAQLAQAELIITAQKKKLAQTLEQTLHPRGEPVPAESFHTSNGFLFQPPLYPSVRRLPPVGR